MAQAAAAKNLACSQTSQRRTLSREWKTRELRKAIMDQDKGPAPYAKVACSAACKSGNVIEAIHWQGLLMLAPSNERPPAWTTRLEAEEMRCRKLAAYPMSRPTISALQGLQHSEACHS